MNNQQTIEGLDPGEQILKKIHRTSVPLFTAYFSLAIGLILLTLLLKTLLPSTTNLDPNQVIQYTAVIIGGLAVLGIVGLELYTYVYRGNYLIITNKKFTQVLRRGLFARAVSELSLVDVEDVTTVKNGVFKTIFNYGTLRVETAGELENFDFKFCPKPNVYGQIVLNARQQFVGDGGGDTHA